MSPNLAGFHNKYYNGSLMRLCVLGRETLDTIQEWVESMFAGVRSTRGSLYRFIDLGLRFVPGSTWAAISAFPWASCVGFE